MSSTTDAEALFQEALVQHRQGHTDAAVALCDRVLALDPRHFNALHLAGVLALHKKAPARAADFLSSAAAINPDVAAVHNNLAAALLDLKQYPAALRACDRALALRADFAGAHNNRGNALRGLRRLPEALASYNAALGFKPDDADALNNRGAVYGELGQQAEALRDYDRAIALQPAFAHAHYNRGVALRETKQHAAALESYARALALDPTYADAHWETSLAHLQMGNFAAGWPAYEWRWKHKALGLLARNFPQPLWLGAESLAGKTILLHAEQGLGDTLQFCRYAKRVADQGARVVLEVQKPLATLLSSLEGVAEIVAQGDPLPVFDMHCPLMSLPLAFKTDLHNIPAPQSYIASTPEKVAMWRTRLGAKTRPRIGVAWSGNPHHKDDRARSLALRDFMKLVPDDFECVGLQTDVRETDKEALESACIRHFGADMKDFTDSAALCELVDVIVSVDTSIVHLAGAMGRAVWVLLSFNADWRWLLDRGDSPWYPSATLYRQSVAGQWDDVFTHVKRDLAALPL